MSLAFTQELSLVPIGAGKSGRALPDGPGWFDSSWELRSGLEVREAWPGEAALNGWIEKWLGLPDPRCPVSALGLV